MVGSGFGDFVHSLSLIPEITSREARRHHPACRHAVPARRVARPAAAAGAHRPHAREGRGRHLLALHHSQQLGLLCIFRKLRADVSLADMNRYAAKLLFQFRVTVGGGDAKRRLCEERIIVLRSSSARTALAQVKSRGRAAEHVYRNSDGNRVRFEFIGVMELLSLGPECEDDEVWYELKERLLPLERKEALIPAESYLSAVRSENEPQQVATEITRCSKGSSRPSSRR